MSGGPGAGEQRRRNRDGGSESTENTEQASTRRHGGAETNGEEAGGPPPRRASRGGAWSERAHPSDRQPFEWSLWFALSLQALPPAARPARGSPAHPPGPPLSLL